MSNSGSVPTLESKADHAQVTARHVAHPDIRFTPSRNGPSSALPRTALRALPHTRAMTSGSPADSDEEWRNIEAALNAIKQRRQAAEAALEAVRQDQSLAVRAAVERGFQRCDIGQAVGLSHVTIWKILRTSGDDKD